ncbi:glycerol-3-phosphate acyltransferase [Clostridium sporogenes]|uniref:glycerol-3-phosphate acyltransferase n=1 Tax=Clostridium sporogenes TaxID=1509 RepID=UPI002149C276|nr:glycerol-3-phosphate acyltransferase [Clostridium sporogenes]MCR1975359.1 glycerol-3-phosphate acyltransferase [Clostridium sporogenes]
MILKLLIIILSSYFIGCFCGAYYYGTIFKDKDIRNFGSGNLGALNSKRVLGNISFIIVLSIDFFKGFTTIIIGRGLGLTNTYVLIIMFAVIIGHIFPIQLKFKGGKGVATFIGALTSYNYLFVLIIFLTFIPVYLITRKFTLSGLISIMFFSFLLFIINGPSKYSENFPMMIIIFIIILKHSENIIYNMK